MMKTHVYVIVILLILPFKNSFYVFSIVISVCATDLHSIGGLVPLLSFLKNNHPGIRAKAADVVTTIVQNNPKSQQLVMEANGLEPLLSNFFSDPDINVRTKALGAISCKFPLYNYIEGNGIS